MSTKRYPSDLTDAEWMAIEPLIPGSGKMGRPPKYTKRELLNGILYIVRSGCAWRMMPSDLPPWDSCYGYFARWKKEGVWARAHDALRDRLRLKSGKKKPRALRSSTLRALRLLSTPEFAAMMQERSLREESGIFSWTRLDSCSPQWSTPQTSRTATEPDCF